MTSTVITYRFGFVPRSLIGSVVSIFVGDNLYKKVVLYTIIIVTALLFMIWIVYLLVDYVWRNPNIVGLVVLIVYVFSPYAKFYLHEMGYYEQYGYILTILLIYLLPRLDIKKGILLSAIFGLIILLISETNAFLVLPSVFFITLIRIIMDTSTMKTYIHNIVWLCVSYIPSLVYCIFVWVVKVPTELVDRLYSYDKAHITDFYFVENVHYYLSGDRSNADVWGRYFREISKECILYPIILIVFVSLLIYNYKGVKLMILYVLTSVISGFCSYVICILAWDLNRYYFGIYMSILFITIYIINNYMRNIKWDKKDISLIIMMFIAVFAICDYKFWLFDGAEYNASWGDFFNMISNP
jgi:hypothetical protein